MNCPRLSHSLMLSGNKKILIIRETKQTRPEALTTASRFRKVAAFARLCLFGGLCVDIWRLVHQWSFFCCLTVFWLFLANGTLYQSSKTLKTIGVQIVTGLPRLYKQCTNGVPIVKTVKNSQNTVKTAQKWPLVYQSSHVYQDTVTLKSRLRVTQGHWKRNHWTDHTRLTISRVIWR